MLRVLRTRCHQPAVERSVERFSGLGEHGGVWLAASLAGALLWPARRSDFLRGARVVAAAYVSNQLIKVIVRRPRPRLDGLPRLTDTASNLSYPSAHATTSSAGARALSRALPGAPLHLFATALALSRPYLGVHYPSDTLAGCVLGVAVEELVP